MASDDMCSQPCVPAHEPKDTVFDKDGFPVMPDQPDFPVMPDKPDFPALPAIQPITPKKGKRKADVIASRPACNTKNYS